MMVRNLSLFLILALSIPSWGQTKLVQPTLSSGGGVSTSATHRLQSVVGQPIAQSHVDREETQSGFLQVANFIIADETPPVISYTGENQKINKQGPPRITATITDNILVASAKIHYRQITGDVASYSEADLANSSGDSFEVQVQQGWFDAMGMEYYFEASDGTNVVRDPVQNDTYYYAYRTSNTETIPSDALGFGTSVENYKIISFPYTTSNNAVATLFEELGPYSDTEWRMATYNNSVNAFEEYPAFTGLSRGKGYWFLAKRDPSGGIQVESVESPAENRNELYRMTLKEGWNLIGNPYPVSISWEDVRTLNNNDPRINEVVVYKGGYDPGDIMVPYSGGFVFIEDGADLLIDIPFEGQTAIGGRIDGHDDFSNDISAEAWLVDLKIKQNGATNSLGGFGMHENASAEKDPFDNLNPPRFLSSPELNFPHPSHPLGNFSRDIIPTQSEADWSFNVIGEVNEPISLHWDNDLGASNLELLLLDENNLTVIDLREVDQYNFNLKANHSFTIHFGENMKEKLSSRDIEMRPPYPNPIDGDSPLSFRFGLPDLFSEYNIRVEIFNNIGRSMVSYANIVAKGVHDVSLPLNESVLGSGLYLYKVTVKSGDKQKVFTGKLQVL